MSLMSIPLARPNGVGVTVTTIVAERSASPPIRHKNSSGAAPCARVTSKSDAASTGGCDASCAMARFGWEPTYTFVQVNGVLQTVNGITAAAWRAREEAYQAEASKVEAE